MHEKCWACEIRSRRAASPITDAMIEEWIVRRLSGDSWSEIARSRGWASNSSTSGASVYLASPAAHRAHE